MQSSREELGLTLVNWCTRYSPLEATPEPPFNQKKTMYISTYIHLLLLAMYCTVHHMHAICLQCGCPLVRKLSPSSALKHLPKATRRRGRASNGIHRSISIPAYVSRSTQTHGRASRTGTACTRGRGRVRASGPADLPRELQLFPINTGHHGDRPICTPGCSLHGDGSHTPPVGGVATPCMKSPQVMLTIKPGTGRAYE